jgi:hypothetical protein
MGSNVNLEEENSPISSINNLDTKTRRNHKRVLVDTNEKNHSTPSPENEYEKLRQERIARNKQMLEQLQLKELAQNLATTMITAQHGNHPYPRPVVTTHRHRHRGPRKPKLIRPTRRSTRARGMSADNAQYSTYENTSIINGNQHDSDIDDQQGLLLTQEAYFKLAGIDITNAIHSNGRYTGWVADTVRTKYGIPSSPNSLLNNTKGRRSSNNTTSNAKAFAATQLKTNPNSYFYRHVGPDERQAQGEWTDEEHAAFLNIVKTWGCGDKWGLFSSHIPQRVGYQCSSYYTNVIIPSGAVIDGRFRLTRSGKPVFVG